MNRFCNCREIHERPWCPGVLRDGLTDFLSFFVIYSGVYRPTQRLLARVLTVSSAAATPQVVELCAGGGLYSARMLEDLRAVPELSGTGWLLTDLYPSRNWHEAEKVSDGAISGYSATCPAGEALQRFDGVFVMFSALHHFPEAELAELLHAAAEHRRTVLFFDYSRRTHPLLEIPALLLSPLLMWLLGWLVRPFSWKRLAFTYLCPVLPMMFFIDGALSRLRSYTTAELEQLSSRSLPGDYHFEAAALKTLGGIAEVHTLIISPDESVFPIREK